MPGHDEWLSLDDTLRLIARLGESRDRIILVGGQALNLWARRYRSSDPELGALFPLVSRDADFYGGPNDIRAVADDLDGIADILPPFDPRPNSGTVTVLENGNARTLDFLKMLVGVDGDNLRAMATPVDMAIDGATFRLHVMHPYHCLQSRITNVAEIAKYRCDRGLRQAQAAVRCTRSFVLEGLQARQVRGALKLNERVFKFAFGSDAARAVARDFGIEAFDAVVADHPALPDEFRERRYPKMCEQIAGRRG